MARRRVGGMQTPKFLRVLGLEGLRTLGFEAIKYALPIGAPIVAAALGYVQGLPLMYIFVGVLVAFAAAATGILRFDEWQVRRRVDGKLTFIGPGAQKILGKGIALGVQFYNSAAFPIEFEITELRTEIANKVPKDKLRPNKKLVIPAGQYGWHYDGYIEFEVPKQGSVNGLLEAKLKYGSVGSSLKYEIAQKKQLTAQFDDEGNWLGSAIWVDVA